MVDGKELDDGSVVEGVPPWLVDLRRSSVASPQVLLFGNVHDLVLAQAGARPGALIDAVERSVMGAGFDGLYVYDAIDGLSARGSEEVVAAMGHLLDLDLTRACPLTLPALSGHLPTIARSDAVKACVVIDFAARLTVQAESLTREEHTFFATCEKLAHAAEPLLAAGADTTSTARYNQVIWVVDRERDLPAWFLGSTDRRLRRIAVPVPGFDDRTTAARGLASAFPRSAAIEPTERERLISRFAERTDGLTLRSMFDIQRLARELDTGLEDIDEVARSYRIGVVDNPWRRPYLRERLAEPSTVTSRVFGQDEAVRRALDVVTRSVTGLNGAHVSGSAERPRGVLFFAGPTGVGKTELAKALTSLLFGDDQYYVRFDMSEFSSEHAEARLIGAPPGYIGHDAGGELTTALRERPFSLVLFDEIEKAHPRILDKFLQILEDGRLTDGAGATTYFSESVLVFTSNLGTYVEGVDGRRQPNVHPAMTRQDLEDAYRSAIGKHFTDDLNRPELLNRLGDNIVVFNFIAPDVGRQIFDRIVANVSARVYREHKATLELDRTVREKLCELAISNPMLGGRNIGSVVESTLVNPLARAIFDRAPNPGDVVRVVGLHEELSAWRLDLA